MEITALASALEEMARVLGADNVLAPREAQKRFGQNTSGLDRMIIGAASPATTEEVQAIVRTANRFRTPVYPISGGRNWGYGSALPAQDGAIIVGLSRMNRIRNAIGLSDHFAAVEPGVTQEQLYGAIQASGLPLIFNSTGSGRQTSVLGNSLDRGFGYFAMRPDDLSNLEVVLGDGEVLRTGFGHYHNALAESNYRFGLGPSLDGLFFQSNLGIVTCASVHLHPRRERHETMLLKLQKEEDFDVLFERIAELRRKGVFESVLHVGSRDRVRVTLAPLIYQFFIERGHAPGAGLRRRAEGILAKGQYAAWTGVGGLYGTVEEVDAKLLEISRRLRGIAIVETVAVERLEDQALSANHETQALLHSAKTLAHFSNGIPSDGALMSPLWAVGLPPTHAADLDGSHLGLLYCCPALPLESAVIREALAMAREVFRSLGFEPHVTLNIVSTKAVLCILNLVFDKRDDAQQSRAHSCVGELYSQWKSRGIYPYRVGVQSMGDFIDSDDPFWQVVQGLKDVFDPNRIILPGRYNLE